MSAAPLASTPTASMKGLSQELLERVGILASTGLLVAATALASGSYFPTAWGWLTLALAIPCVLASVLARDLRLTRRELAFLGFLGAFIAWDFASAIWTSDLPLTMLDGERSLAYLAAVGAALLVLSRHADALLAGCLAGITVACTYGLATYLVPNRIGRLVPVAGYRLNTPIGYWNSLGLFAGFGVVLAVGFVARGRSALSRGLACASLAVLVPTVQFTFSRAAWGELVVGMVVALVLSPARENMLTTVVACMPAPLAAVVVGAHSHALTSVGAPIGQATHEGRTLALTITLLVLPAFALGALRARVPDWKVPGLRLRPQHVVAVLTGLLVLLLVATVPAGGPLHLAQRAWDRFAARPTVGGSNLNSRLFTVNGSYRAQFWRVAAREFRSAPITGTGAGTFQNWWNRYRPFDFQVIDAHSLYLQTLAELGIVGLGLLLVALAFPVVAAWRFRAEPFVCVAGAAYAMYVTHATIDWDWQIPGITVPALLCGAVCLTAGGEPRLRLQRLARGSVAFAGAAVTGLAVVGLVGNIATSRAWKLLGEGHYPQARSEAKRAAGWAPWAAEPQIVLGSLAAEAGDETSALADFRTATRREPASYVVWYLLAESTSGAVQRHAAETAIRLDPLSPVAPALRGLARGSS